MARGPKFGPAQGQEDDTQAAGGGPKRMGYPTYAEVARQLFENGYEPLPLLHKRKRPSVEGWTTVAITEALIARWIREFPDAGVGLRTGSLVGIDIDILDHDIAHQMGKIVEERVGDTLMRVGLWPKRLYLARTNTPFAKLSIGKLEILGKGQQLVAFGIHPDTRQPYYWPGGDIPLDVPLFDLSLMDEAACRDLMSELAALQPEIGAGQRRRRGASGHASTCDAPTRNADGLVVDGRDGWLSSIAYHAVQDALDAGAPFEAEDLADRVWQNFTTSTDLSRTKQDGGKAYTFHDALKKVRDKLGLLDAGRLPPRVSPDAEPVAVDPGLPLEDAREKLGSAIHQFCVTTEAWHAAGREGPAPRVGLRASVGLGKTAVSRDQLLQAQARLKAAGLPHRILVFTPSLALADESASNWERDGLRVAVHRGYEAKLPGGDIGICRDITMVRMAIASGQSVFPNACLRRGGSRCHNFDVCDKQENLSEVQSADVVLAAYDSLFTGLSIKADQIAAMVIDEGCWERAIKKISLDIAEITRPSAVDQPRMVDPAMEEKAWADVYRLRGKVVAAFQANGTGVMSRQAVVDAGLTVQSCAIAASLEVHLRADPGLRPGLPQGARRQAEELSRDANLSVRRETVFHALAHLLHGEPEKDGRIEVLPPAAETGAQAVRISGLHQIHEELRGLPILHLDATLRTELAATVLPGMEVENITAAMPHLHLTAVQGRFAKTTLVEDPKADPAENRRRANRLKECVDYVRWHARRSAPGRTLVVTHKDIECAFVGISGVVTGHFKAIAGLDSFKDVALLIVIGRPMPSDLDIAHLTGAYLGHVPSGGYQTARRGLLMRDGSRRNFAVRQHEDPRAEELRAAVCDDEIIQAIGRGRGVNRTTDTPLEVHLLADVALPLVHDQVVAWDMICPDVFQRMLLQGLAVDSPADAAALHPDLFNGEKQAQKAFERAGFKRQNPICNSYREMSLKSARYRRGGRGRSWQRVWWIDGAPDAVRDRLERVLGALEGWGPSQSLQRSECRFSSFRCL